MTATEENADFEIVRQFRQIMTIAVASKGNLYYVIWFAVILLSGNLLIVIYEVSMLT